MAAFHNKSDTDSQTDTGIDRVGERLRQRRRNLRLTLAEVSRDAGITEGFLSQVERDRSTASIATLQKICRALGMGVGDLFTDQEALSVHRYRHAQFGAFGQRGQKVRITPAQNELLEAFLGNFEPYGTTGDEAYFHGDSEELVTIISGQVEVQVGDELHILSALDSISYRSSTPHRIREIAGEPATLLWVMSPPSY